MTILITGQATPEGTARFRDRFASRLPGHFRASRGLWLSSIGIGTALGEPTAQFDTFYREAIIRALELGTNVLDSAVNYRHMRSERSIGHVLSDRISSGKLKRDEVFVATKGGFLSFESEEPPDPAEYLRNQFIQSGLVDPLDIAAGHHVMSPAYLSNQIDVSRRNLGVETIDLYYIHNPETQLRDHPPEEFYSRIARAFQALEGAVKENRIGMYGLATWKAFRVKPEAIEAVSLSEVWKVAEAIAGRDHHFHAIQLPFNLGMPEAFGMPTQELDGRRVSPLHLVRQRGLLAFASASLLQRRLCQGLLTDLQNVIPGMQTDAQRAIQFVRSAPGITSALVGMSRAEHVEENLGAAKQPPMSQEEFDVLFAE